MRGSPCRVWLRRSSDTCQPHRQRGSLFVHLRTIAARSPRQNFNSPSALKHLEHFLAVPTSIPKQCHSGSGRLLHILSTSLLSDDDVLVYFADGSSAIYEMEELEKLRPIAKKIFPAPISEDGLPLADVA